MGTTSSMIHVLFSFLSIAKLPCCRSVSFSYDFSNSTTFNRSDITIDGSANLDGLIELTQNAAPEAKDMYNRAGRASYSHPVPLWDKATGEVTSFSTRFSFVIMSSSNDSTFAPSDGLAFYLSPYPPTMPPFEGGGFLGLFTNSTAMNSSAVSPVVAVEFDTFQNVWDRSNDDHIGIDVNSINSIVVKPLRPPGSLSSSTEPMAASVSYNSSTRTLAAVLQMGPKDGGMRYEVNSMVDLKSVLPAQVAVGFSAASGWSVELHRVLTWSFDSTLVVTTQDQPRENATRGGDGQLVVVDSSPKRKTGVVAGAVLASVAAVVGLLWFLVTAMRRRRKSRQQMREEYEMGGSDECAMDDEFEQGTGPRRFLYGQLATATNDFSEKGKLGEGGFGSVYRGSLAAEPAGGLQLQEVAVKRISKTSKQGRKEYAAEVRIISRLRHRNLVQLVGWCHGRGDFLLVYELVPNGSLDTHLYGTGSTSTSTVVLSWPIRYEIALGLGSALLYLHSGCEKCVVHRDIKPSNIMLDSDFGAKLGDFGLAKLVDHGDASSQTTVLAGTMGYMDPEYAASGKASTASDVYSFGIVLLEMCCGRRPVLPREEPIKSRLLEWVWDLHGRGAILEATDERLQGDFDGRQMECVMVVGLWCAHPDHGVRPSIKQALGALQFEAPLPALPPKMPVPTYSSPSAAASSLSNGNNSSSAALSSSTSGERSTSSSSAATAESSWLLKQQQGTGQ